MSGPLSLNTLYVAPNGILTSEILLWKLFFKVCVPLQVKRLTAKYVYLKSINPGFSVLKVPFKLLILHLQVSVLSLESHTMLLKQDLVSSQHLVQSCQLFHPVSLSFLKLL